MIMRKKISPFLIISWLITLVLISYTVVLYINASGSQRICGIAIKDDIFEINSITVQLDKQLSSDQPDLIILSNLAGRLYACGTGSGINDDYFALTEKVTGLVYEYSKALAGQGELTPSAVEMLKADAEKYNTFLHEGTQYIMSLLNSTNTKKMDLNYFDARMSSDYNNKLISSYVKSLQENKSAS